MLSGYSPKFIRCINLQGTIMSTPHTTPDPRLSGEWYAAMRAAGHSDAECREEMALADAADVADVADDADLALFLASN